MNRSEKVQIVNEVVDQIKRAKSIFLTDFTGITVEQVNELRREFRKSNVGYRVLKNTLARKAFEKVPGYDAVNAQLTGPTAIAFGYDDPTVPAKIIKKFRDKYQKLTLKACFIENTFYDGSRIDELAMLPSRAEIMSGILTNLQAPISNLVSVIGSVMRDLICVIDAIEKKKAA